MTKRVEVAAGVILRKDGRFLLGQRAPDTYYPGYWEFPGGKVEARETPSQALVRELDEELGIEVTTLRPWLVREHAYEHAHVRLHFFEVAAWRGEIDDRVHSALSWEDVDAPTVGPMLPANGPILKALRLPRCMGITSAVSTGVDASLARLDAALERGLRLIQVREPDLPGEAARAFAAEVVRRAHRRGAWVVINSDQALATASGADGVHLRSAALAGLAQRPDFEWVGASCHTRAELERAAALGLDYAVLGAVHATPTHPGQRGLGWDTFADLVRGLPLPVLALGGVGPDDMDSARMAGAHGIAAIRGAWRD